MSLFRSSFHPSGDFAPLFRLLDDYDRHRSHSQSAVRGFAPKFDVRESESAFHLDGELPGIAQEDINIEFTDPQTLVVKGRTEREYHHSSEPSKNQSNSSSNDTEQAVETADKAAKNNTKTASNGHRYWASERTVGEFSRTFSFPNRVDQDHVKASLKNGILSILVPKATAPATKKITIE
ncbi:30 kDa heat shock protein [Penicillium diatomitis]|uniref:30 kDa heat shock protein n=1 Tax=Penicillium diatomitis TaxID=2819901 RepID=A0A9W9XES2_9EURO|nr:30 kDa heat shock protein [Penicillium diatomitis]KAJ5490832.1 30 kDa heat shock protein [Penicillium diatomitis]